jgi:chemotaxis receptor (MCP) glutamine deamidase CheD
MKEKDYAKLLYKSFLNKEGGTHDENGNFVKYKIDKNRAKMIASDIVGDLGRRAVISNDNKMYEYYLKTYQEIQNI